MFLLSFSIDFSSFLGFPLIGVVDLPLTLPGEYATVCSWCRFKAEQSQSLWQLSTFWLTMNLILDLLKNPQKNKKNSLKDLLERLKKFFQKNNRKAGDQVMLGATSIPKLGISKRWGERTVLKKKT